MGPFQRLGTRVETHPLAFGTCQSRGGCRREFHRGKPLQPQKSTRYTGLIPYIPHAMPMIGSKVRVSALYGEQWLTPEDQYLCVGLAHCFEKADDGKLVDRLIIEPISANSLEAMSHGAKTSFLHVFSLLLKDAISKTLPSEFDDGVFCDEYETRCDAAARTWMRPRAVDDLMDIVPLGMVKSSFNYDTTDMRVLNFDNIVRDDDNIKQDISIDVYGRKQEEDTEKRGHDDAQGGDDGIDSLLAA